VTALATGDERAACATRTRRERERMARTAGSCESAFRALMATTDFAPLRDARVGTVTVRGDSASVDYEVPGDDGPDSKLRAVKEEGRWVLIGDGSGEPPSTAGTDEQPAPAVQEPPCPSGTRLVRAADMLDRLPPGYELARAAEPPPVVDVLRAALHGRLRRIETKVLVRGESRRGTGVIVLNSPRRAPERVLAEFAAGARAAGVDRPPERIEIAGRKAALIHGPGGFFATALAGPCALVMLTDGDRARLLRTAALLHAPRR
jgi:hypothetical protein